MSTQYILFSDYEKATGESVAVFLPRENMRTLYNMMSNYKSSKSDAYQFVLSEKPVEKPEYITPHDIRTFRSYKIRREYVDGKLELPEELLSSTPTDQMIALLGNGGIIKYIAPFAN